MDLALALLASKLEICSGSQLVVDQIEREYEAKDERMAQYLSKVQNTLDKLSKWAIKRISRTKNIQVDALAGIAGTLPMNEAVLLPVHLQTTSSIVGALICNTSEMSVGWMHEIKTYLQTGDLTQESKQAHKIWV